uniref:DNA-directed RNA polymerase subunit alpha n=1 Tax=Gloeochaete wittrockiana TaxID=38269 RepID=A0A3G1IW32_9EUKA|nr:RNA polymerase alpha subunit [Gloeochaete wittrockiana]ASQ40233.1 RNA polymerase alpha subunit [Gloeochaete wittrockiana]
MVVFHIDYTEFDVHDSYNQYGSFSIEFLESGQAITVGNTLRRVLLGDLEVSAITAVRIEELTHEFNSVIGLREDFFDFSLNLKKVVLKSYTSEPQIGRLSVKGPTKIFASQMDLPSDIEIVNPTQYLGTLSENSSLNMEVQIRRGKGYLANIKHEEKPILGFIPIDTIFMPVHKVNYSISDQLVDNKSYERLTIEIWTNGSLSPLEALNQAAGFIVDLFSPLCFNNKFLPKTEQNLDVSKDDIIQENEHKQLDKIPIEDLALSIRAYNCLKRAEIHSIGDLLECSPEDLLQIRNFGKKSAKEVLDALQDKFGLDFMKSKSKNGK